MKRKKTNATWEYEYLYVFNQEQKPKQLWYLAVSVGILMASFIALILIS